MVANKQVGHLSDAKVSRNPVLATHSLGSCSCFPLDLPFTHRYYHPHKKN
jgi:hypothetical protein